MSVRKLSDLNRVGKGVDKCWIYKDRLNFELAHDYLQKINFSIQDINDLLKSYCQIGKRTDIILLIVMVNWIVDSIWRYKTCLLPGLLDDFHFSDQETLCKSFYFIKGIRSFIIAHPLNTEKHAKFGFDGDTICIDLRVRKPILCDYLCNYRSNIRRTGLNGIETYESEQADDFYLYVYSKRANAEFFELLVINLNEILQVARKYIQQLYEIDCHLSRLKKKNYVAK